MRNLLATMIVVLAACSAATDTPVSGSRNGELRQTNGEVLAWHSGTSEWVSPLEFWHRYANSRDGLTWGARGDYPPYAEVSEHDLLIIETEHGPCLMEFFHTRWRRANDVRRWDPGFNDYGGCPRVFD